MSSTTHRGPVVIRFDSRRERFTVLCPAGHLVTGGSTAPDSGFNGGFRAAQISDHQSGVRPWLVDCDGAL